MKTTTGRSAPALSRTKAGIKRSAATGRTTGRATATRKGALRG
jgi:hypothetical protein